MIRERRDRAEGRVGITVAYGPGGWVGWGARDLAVGLLGSKVPKVWDKTSVNGDSGFRFGERKKTQKESFKMSVAAASYFPLSLAELHFQNQLFLGMVSLPLLFCLCFLCCLPYRAAFRSKPCTCNEGRTGYGTLPTCPSCTSPNNSFGDHDASSPSTSFSSMSSGRASPPSPQISRSVLVNIDHHKSMADVSNKKKNKRANTICDIEAVLLPVNT